MDKKIAKIGMIMVLTLALIISSLGVFNFGDNLSNEFDVTANQTTENSGGGALFQPKNGNLNSEKNSINENSFLQNNNNNKLTAQAATTPTVWNGTATPFFAASSTNPGTEANPYLIDTAEKLAYLAQRVKAADTAYNDKHYKLTADIVLNDTANWTTWTKDNPPTNKWTPIGDHGKEFKGTFDGDNHTVSGIWTFLNSAAGLFGCVGDKAPSFAVVKNVGVIKSHVMCNDFFLGAVVGQNYGTIENCYNTGKVTLYVGVSVGGVVGYNSGKVINCYNAGSVELINPSTSMTDCTGGIVGQNAGSSIINCYNTGRVSGAFTVGGIVGYSVDGLVTNCYNSGAVSGNTDFGGIAGANGMGYQGSIVSNCYSLNNGLPINGYNDTYSLTTNCSLIDANKKLVSAGGTTPNTTNEALVTFAAGADLKDTLNAGVKEYNAKNPTLTPLSPWVQSGNGYPTFGIGFSIDETPLKPVTYDGNDHPFIIKSIPEGLTTGFTRTYQKNGTGGFTANVPKDVGSYDVKVTRAEDATYAAFETTITGGVAITPKPLTVTPKTDTAATVTKVYDGNTTFTGAITSGTHYTLDKVGSEDVSLTIDTKTFDSKIASDSKTVTITYTAVLTGAASANYSVVAGTFSIKGKITKKPLTVTAATGGAAWEKVYDGKVGYTGAVNNTHYTLDTNGADVVLLTLGDKNFDTKDVLTATKVTVNYSTVLTGADSANYSVVAGSFDHPAKITPKALTDIKVEKKGDGSANFSVQLSTTNCKGFVDGDIVNINFATSAATEGIYNGNAGGIPGAVTLTGANAGNYSVAKEQVIATITKNTLPAITGITDTIYSGLEQPVTPVLAGTATADYTLTWEYAVNGIDFAVETAPKFKNAGTYRVTATGKGNYVGSTSVGDYIIAPKVVTLNWTDPPTGLVYDGNAKIPSVTVEGLISPDTFGVTVALTNGSNINVGTFTYTAKATAPLNTNYALPTVATKDYAIAKAPNAWINPTKPLSIESIKEGGTLNPIAKSLLGTAKFTYYADNNGTIGTEIVAPAKPTAIGTYWVKAHVADDPNYSGIPDTGTEISFKISKKSDGGGGGPASSITNQDFFWTGVIIDLKNKDDTVLKRECDYGTMPKNVLETIQDTNKTLDITMMGENLYITSEKIKGLTFDKSEYTIEEIKAMLADKPVITPTPTPDPVDPTPEKPANYLWLWILLIIIAISIILAFIIEKKKKQDNTNENNKK